MTPKSVSVSTLIVALGAVLTWPVWGWAGTGATKEVSMHWCGDHPRYEAKREPSGLCKTCWQLYKYSHPEAIEVLQREYREAQGLLTDAS